MSGAGSSDSGLDLSGKLIIKAQLGVDIRRIPIHNEDMTYDELILMMQRVFRGSLSTDDDITLKYKDEDGDLVTIFDSSDLAFAIQCSRILKLSILLNGKRTMTQELCVSTSDVRRELRAIRDRVTALLDALDVSADVTPRTVGETDIGVSSSVAASASPAPPATMQLNISSKEFDPLQQAEQQQQQVQQPQPQQQQQQHVTSASQQPAVSTPTPASSASIHSEVSSNVEDPSVYRDVMSSFGLSEGEVPAKLNATQGENTTPATGSSTPTPYQQAQQQQPPPPQSQPQSQPNPPQQTQPPSQPPQQQQHPGYPNYSAVAVSAPQHGPYPQYQGQPFLGGGSEVASSGPPRTPVQPTSLPGAPTGVSQSVPQTQTSHYFQGYHQYQGYGVPSSQPGGFSQQYPTAQQYTANYTTQAGPRSSGPPPTLPSQPAQPGLPSGPRPPVRYSTPPTTGFQPWPQ